MVTSLTDSIIKGRKMDQNKIQKKFRRINQKFSTRNPHIEIGKKDRITRVDQPGRWPGRPLSRKSDLRRVRWETPSHVKNKQKSVLSRENVICKGPVPNKSLACWWNGRAGSLGGCGMRWCWRMARDSSHWFTFWGKWDPMEEFKRGRDMIWISFAC